MVLVVLHVELDPQVNLGEGGHNAVHGDLITHPGHGPNHCEGLDSPQSTSVGAHHFPFIWLKHEIFHPVHALGRSVRLSYRV